MQEIPSETTQQVKLSDLAVRRMFDEAKIAETLREVDPQQRRPNEAFRLLVVQLALWTL